MSRSLADRARALRLIKGWKRAIIDEVEAAVERWKEFSSRAGVPKDAALQVAAAILGRSSSLGRPAPRRGPGHGPARRHRRPR